MLITPLASQGQVCGEAATWVCGSCVVPSAGWNSMTTGLFSYLCLHNCSIGAYIASVFPAVVFKGAKKALKQTLCKTLPYKTNKGKPSETSKRSHSRSYHPKAFFILLLPNKPQQAQSGWCLNWHLKRRLFPLSPIRMQILIWILNIRNLVGLLLINVCLNEDLGRKSIRVIMTDAARCWLPRKLNWCGCT